MVFVNVVSEMIKAALPTKPTTHVQVQLAMDENNTIKVKSTSQNNSDLDIPKKEEVKSNTLKKGTKKKKSIASQLERAVPTMLQRNYRSSYRIGQFKIEAYRPEFLRSDYKSISAN